MIVSVVAVTVFLVSMMYSGTLVAVPRSNNTHFMAAPLTPGQESGREPGPDNGTFVWWTKDSNSTTDQWSWTGRNWLYGPKPPLTILYPNVSEVGADGFVDIGELVTLSVVIPNDLIPENRTIGAVRVNGWLSTNRPNFSANFELGFYAYYDPPMWGAYSNVWNGSDTGPSMPQPSFVEIEQAACSNHSDATAMYVEFAARFNSTTPIGLYSLDIVIDDDLGQYITSAGQPDIPPLAIGLEPALAWGMMTGGAYTLQKLDLNNEALYAVSRDTDFKMRVNVTGPRPDVVQLWMDLPQYVEMDVNVTGPYYKTVVKYGGWQYDEATGTYVWNASARITTRVWAYGPHMERCWVNLNTWKEIDAYYLSWEWNETTQQSEPVVRLEKVGAYASLFITYNRTSDSWFAGVGFRYYIYPYDHYVPNFDSNVPTTIYDTSGDFPVMYELNTSLCSAGVDGSFYVVEFVGHFTDDMPKTDEYTQLEFFVDIQGPEDTWYEPAVWGDYPLQTQVEFDLARKIAIDSPVVVARLLNADGSEPRGWLFQVDKGTNFMVKGMLQGGGEIADDIDAVRLELNAYDEYWSENESISYQITYRITFGMDGTPTLEGFNYTTKQNYTYGLHWDYVYTNITGWHYEYNASSNDWVWVYGNYSDWVYQQVEGWYWSYWYFNQRTGEWQQESVESIGADTAIPSDFAVVSNFAKQVVGKDLYVSFLVNMSANVRDTVYWWSFSFMNNTWYEDTASPWGEHLVEAWGYEYIYSAYYNGHKLFVDSIDDSALAYKFMNGTLGSDYMLGKENPYIVIDGQKLPVRVIESYDPMSGTTDTWMFFYSHYDDTADRNYWYYELKNGTKVYVTYDDVVPIYNVTIAPGNSFLTSMTWEKNWYYDGQYYYYWIDIYGQIHQGTDFSYTHDGAMNITLYDRVKVTDWQWYQFVRYGEQNILNITNYWWESRDDCYYMMDTDGNLYKLVYDPVSSYYKAFIDGQWQIVSYPLWYYESVYNGQPVMLVEGTFQSFWYYEHNGVKHEMPYPGANGCCDWDLNHIVSDGGVVPTTKSLIYNGSAYAVEEDTQGGKYVVINGVVYGVMEYYVSHAVVNGTSVWDLDAVGFTVEAGEYDPNLQFTPTMVVKYNVSDASGFPDFESSVNAYTIHLLDGTTWLINQTNILNVYEYQLGNETFYSLQTGVEFTFDEQLNKTVYWYVAINGTKIYIDEYEPLPIVGVYQVNTFTDATDWTEKFVFPVDGKIYNVTIAGFLVWTWRVLNASYSQDLYIQDIYSARKIYEFNYGGSLINATAYREPILRRRTVWGYAFKYGPVPLKATVYNNFDSLIVGIPEWGMWGMSNWAVDTSNGALDLDGNFDTTDDQYYVLEEYTSTDTWNHTWNYLYMHLMWDPNCTQFGDEINLDSWMGVDWFHWNYEWNDTFYWFHAADFTPVNSTEMQEIKSLLFTPEGDPRPGYWDIAWTAKNVTWDDILAEAEANGWDWYDEDGQTWTWLSFGMDQRYGTSYVEGDVDHWLEVNLHYEFSGLMIWEDDNENGLMDVDLSNPGGSELTHYLIPDSVGSVSFVTPGEAYGDFNASDDIRLNLTDEVTWGVTFYDVNGTVFPFTSYGYWDWYDGVVTGTDLRTFDERPTKIQIDELSFLVHFRANVTDDINNPVTIKVDNYVGNWDVDLIGGRKNLENRSLALNYFSEVQMSDFAFKANGSFADSESTVSADTFELETAGARFAEMIMGGVTYDWGKNTSAPFDVVSYTTPLGTFRTAYESDNGMSATAWSFSTSMYMVSIGFPEWDGYYVYQDPVFVSYVSSRGTSEMPGGVTFGTFSIEPAVPTSSDYVTVRVTIFSAEQIDSVTLYYSTDQENWDSTSMTLEDSMTAVGTIPPFSDGTQVYFKVGVSTPSGYYESDIQSYIVGQGYVTSTTTTSAPGPTGGGFGLGDEALILVGGVAVVAVVVIVLVARRRK